MYRTVISAGIYISLSITHLLIPFRDELGQNARMLQSQLFWVFKESIELLNLKEMYKS